MAEIEVRGEDDVARALADLLGRVDAPLRAALGAWLLGRAARLARYPAPRPNQRYRRTGTLGRRWTAAAPQLSGSGGAFVGRIGNNTPYAPEVQGERQARAFVGRWQTVDEVAADGASDLERRIVDAIDQAARGALS